MNCVCSRVKNGSQKTTFVRWFPPCTLMRQAFSCFYCCAVQSKLSDLHASKSLLSLPLISK